MWISTLTPRLAAAAPPATAPKTMPNGVRTWTEGRTDVYELPSVGAGVPRRITVENRHWWQGGDKLRAADTADQKMSIRAWDRTLYVTDAKTGVTTQLDRDTLAVRIKAKEQSKQRPILNGSHSTTTCPLEEQLLPDGDIRILTNHKTEESRVVYGMVRDMGAANCSLITQHDEDYEETRLGHAGEEPATHRWHLEKETEPKDLGEVRSHIDQSGDLIFGDGQTFHLFVPPHAVAQSQGAEGVGGPAV